jgi:hypothetical protein
VYKSQTALDCSGKRRSDFAVILRRSINNCAAVYSDFAMLSQLLRSDFAFILRRFINNCAAVYSDFAMISQLLRNDCAAFEERLHRDLQQLRSDDCAAMRSECAIDALSFRKSTRFHFAIDTLSFRSRRATIDILYRDQGV